MADTTASPALRVGSPAKAGLRKRTTGSSRAGGASSAASSRPSGSGSSMMRIYTDDSPGIKVDPVVVLVFSLAFIASVFMLHIIGKWSRS